MPAAFLDVSGAAGGDALPRHVAVRGPGGARGGAGPLRGHSGAAALPQAFGRARHGKESGWLACESPSDTKDARVPRRHGRDLLQEEEGEAPQTPRGGPAEPACAGRAILICIVAMNFCSGILLVNSVKYIYAIFGFNFPLFVASSHMVFSWALTSFIVGARSEKAQLMSQAQRLHKVFPIAVLNASSIACANSALLFIYSQGDSKNLEAPFTNEPEVICDHFGPLGCNFYRTKRRIPLSAGHRLAPRRASLDILLHISPRAVSILNPRVNERILS
ncbi:unnamed protein product [Prorocentrum cordatum]|uniref:Sugar phosphate transporter domain-containing protein n=1 Tax=Prorocentrum cordatum TaxID=2364126 RepID=A0ABN9Y425_9DINO|nr:unnamed protein product [Polarella glacialis]